VLGPDESEVLRRRVPTPARDYAAVVATIVTLVDDAERELGVRGSVGIGTPGARSRATGRMKNANSTVLIDRPFADDVARALGRPIRIANDANCFALSEATDGAASDVRVAFGVILGTGVGGGLVVDGRIVVGRNDIAGEWGHNPLPWPRDDERPGPPCYCGKSGCIETFVSGTGLQADYRRHGGAALDGAAIARAAAAGAADARATLERYMDRLARRWQRWSTSSIPMRLCSAAAFPMLRTCTQRYPNRCARMFFPIPSKRRSCRRGTVIPAAFAARRDSGTTLRSGSRRRDAKGVVTCASKPLAYG